MYQMLSHRPYFQEVNAKKKATQKMRDLHPQLHSGSRYWALSFGRTRRTSQSFLPFVGESQLHLKSAFASDWPSSSPTLESDSSSSVSGIVGVDFSPEHEREILMGSLSSSNPHSITALGVIFARQPSISFKSDGQEKSTKILVSWQELKNQFLLFFVHR